MVVKNCNLVPTDVMTESLLIVFGLFLCLSLDLSGNSGHQCAKFYPATRYFSTVSKCNFANSVICHRYVADRSQLSYKINFFWQNWYPTYMLSQSLKMYKWSTTFCPKTHFRPTSMLFTGTYTHKLRLAENRPTKARWHKSATLSEDFFMKTFYHVDWRQSV